MSAHHNIMAVILDEIAEAKKQKNYKLRKQLEELLLFVAQKHWEHNCLIDTIEPII